MQTDKRQGYVLSYDFTLGKKKKKGKEKKKEKRKKKIDVLPATAISEYLGWSIWKYIYFFNSFFFFIKSTQKYNIWVHFSPFC